MCSKLQWEMWRITTKLGNLIFTLKFLMQSYRHNFRHLAPNMYRILLKNIFTNLLKILRITSFTNHSHILHNYDPLSRKSFLIGRLPLEYFFLIGIYCMQG